MSADPQPHPLNVVGPFYVVDGCCIRCDLPLNVAPELFQWETDAKGEVRHCYVCRQPQTPEQLTQMMEVVESSEVACIRYRGSDPKVIEMLRQRRCESQIDSTSE